MKVGPRLGFARVRKKFHNRLVTWMLQGKLVRPEGNLSPILPFDKSLIVLVVSPDRNASV